jgi:hypothetical protein
MSGPDQSDDDKGFLARWSQRKQEAKQPERDASIADSDVTAGPATAAEAPPPEFDLSSLPKLEELTSTTDITAFLRKGVPEHLRNAALRKSWALDPAIRNYVNPALDYAYDWNTPGGVPGSSELGTGMDIARLVSQIMGTGESAAEAAAADDPATEQVSDPVAPDLPTEALRLSETMSAPEKPSLVEEKSPQMTSSEEDNSVAPQQTVRRHGSAKPLV